MSIIYRTPLDAETSAELAAVKARLDLEELLPAWREFLVAHCQNDVFSQVCAHSPHVQARENMFCVCLAEFSCLYFFAISTITFFWSCAVRVLSDRLVKSLGDLMLDGTFMVTTFYWF